MSHFGRLQSQAPSPIRHPESIAFKTRFKGRYQSAAVLIPLIDKDDQLQVLLTQRATHLRHHPGQISFPGGRKEPNDGSPEKTALRESYEEIGLDSAQVKVLGRLGDYYTVSGYQVTPIVSSIEQPFKPVLDTDEVSRLLSVPLDFLMNPNNFSLKETLYNGEMRHYYSARYNEDEIWGVTAGIIVALYEALIDR